MFKINDRFKKITMYRGNKKPPTERIFIIIEIHKKYPQTMYLCLDDAGFKTYFSEQELKNLIKLE
jgi:hypothetical protein